MYVKGKRLGYNYLRGGGYFSKLNIRQCVYVKVISSSSGGSRISTRYRYICAKHSVAKTNAPQNQHSASS